MVAVRTPTIALVGNPNTGKTTLFNALAGMNQHVGNYPGVTVDTKKGKFRHGALAFDIIDLPGTYSLAPRSPDEMLAVDVILGNVDDHRPDVVVTIVDASNLERNLYLTTQVLELGVPVIIALNMVDVADGQGLKIDIAKLSQQLGVPIVPLQANKGKGLTELKDAIVAALEKSALPEGPLFPDTFEQEVASLKSITNGHEPTFLLRRMMLDVGGHTETRLFAKHGAPLSALVAAARQRLLQGGFKLASDEVRIRYGWIRQRTAGCVQRPAVRPVSATDRIDKLLTHKVWGTLIFLAVMFLVFESIFLVGDPLKRVIDVGNNLLKDLVVAWMPAGMFRSLIVDGIIKGVGSIVVFVPQIMILFAIIAVLEDCGYMSRAAFLMDRIMARAGLNGKSFIPLLSSMACAVPGILSARVIENPRDRLATILVAPLMSCSARLPVYSLLIGAFLTGGGLGWWAKGLAYFSLYMIGILVAPLIALLLKSTLLRGETPVFVMEMPLYKWPSLRTVTRRAYDAGWMFLKRAGTMILASMVVVWGLLYFPHGDFPQRVAEQESALEVPREKLLELAKALDHLETEDVVDEHAVDAKREELKAFKEKEIEPIEAKVNELHAEWKAQSYLGQVGHWIEPIVEPLGWDWRIGMAALASFPAREVMVGTLGIIFGEGEGDIDENDYRDALTRALQGARRDDKPVFSIPVALSVMVFFALCCQCVSTLVVIKRETNSWFWPTFTFTYMTLLAYGAAFATFQIARLF